MTHLPFYSLDNSKTLGRLKMILDSLFKTILRASRRITLSNYTPCFGSLWCLCYNFTLTSNSTIIFFFWFLFLFLIDCLPIHPQRCKVHLSATDKKYHLKHYLAQIYGTDVFLDVSMRRLTHLNPKIRSLSLMFIFSPHTLRVLRLY